LEPLRYDWRLAWAWFDSARMRKQIRSSPFAPHASLSHLGLAMPMAMRWPYAISVTEPISGELSSDLVPNLHTDLVPAQGFEPWTIGLKDRCSNQAELRRLNTILGVLAFG
jgi:hypothetical protein